MSQISLTKILERKDISILHRLILSKYVLAGDRAVISMASSLSRKAWAARLLYPALFLAHVLYATDPDVFCNAGVYGNPVSTQCIGILARFPIHDTAFHYFVEQQLRTAPPEAVWNGFKDPRPPGQAQAIVQLPKWVSFGQPVLQAILYACYFATIHCSY